MSVPANLHTSVLNSLDEQIAVIDHTGVIVDVNRAWLRFGRDNGMPDAVRWVGDNYLEALLAAEASGDASAGVAAQGILSVLRGDEPGFYCEYPCHSPDEQRWFLMRVTPLRDVEGPLFVVSHHNITQRKLAELRLEALALHDPLTGLANRRGFDGFLENEWRRAARVRYPISLIALDVDHFKAINDAFGHPAGDSVLMAVGQVLLSLSRRPSDLAARLGGDEFVLVLGNADAVHAREVARAILERVHGLAPDLGAAAGQTARIGVSLGVATLIPLEHETPARLVHAADKALYQAKSAGRDQAAEAAQAAA